MVLTASFRLRAGANGNEDCGEFRSNGGQSIIHGIHPDTGQDYEVIENAPPATIEFADIVWPEEIINPPTIQPDLMASATEETEESEDKEEMEDKEDIQEVGVWLFSVHSIEDALNACVPTSVHQNYGCALKLARAVKALELQTTKFTPEQHRDIHNQWLVRAAKFLRPGQSHEEYLIEYLNAYALANPTLATGWYATMQVA